ncbi:MAG: membrane protein insertase YidC [Hyphomicrobiaceae bacterium]|nr:membrane protein insertase YidC [Hyphomicrobiaceae bacterium]
MQTQQPDNQKNLLIAIILSIAVLLGWQMLYGTPRQQDKAARPAPTQTAPSPGATAPDGAAPAAPGTAAPSIAPAAPTREAALAASPRVAIDTPSVRGSIALRGARIDDLVLKHYRETVNPASPNVVLLSPAEGPNAYFAEHGWVAPGGATVRLPGRDTVWRVEKGGPLTPASPVTLVWDNEQGLIFRRSISIDDRYMFKVTNTVENRTGADVTLYPYARLRREGTPVVQGFYILHEGLIGVLGETGLHEISYADALKENGGAIVEKAAGGWLGITDKYWASTLIPNQSEPYRATMSGQPSAEGRTEAYQTDYLLPATVVPGGGQASAEGMLYAGARQVAAIQHYADTFGIKQFDLLIDWGWFYFITKPLFYLIDWLYGLLGNFGLAILAVTVIVKAAFFPLANKSYESMAKMKKLQPEMERIRDRLKDDKMRQQQELMALYQKEKINPLAGCLPILIQIPVFFALYKVLFVTIDMRHAPFFGWIQDLSAPDPTSVFNLFGLLPFAVPEFLHVGAWPLIMGVTMWLQMQLNPQQPDPIQQKIFNWMPVLFTFLLAAFPAGLVIYWAWNNILSLAQQWLIMKRQGVDVPILANLKRNLAPVVALVTGKTDAKARNLAVVKPVKPSPSKPAAEPSQPAQSGSDAVEMESAPANTVTDGTDKKPTLPPPGRASRKAEARSRRSKR